MDLSRKGRGRLKALYQDIRQKLAAGGIDAPEREARLLLKEVLGLEDTDFIMGTLLDIMPEVEDKLAALTARRLAGEPLSKILGLREFWGLPFRVTADVLDPRPDTETVIERALALFKDKPPARILDLGTGSGCLLVTLLHVFPESQGVAIDLSPAALEVAEGNAHLNGVAGRARFVQGSWFEPLAGEAPFDLVVSNPPYIPSVDIPNLDREVRNHDPILALDGGFDGLDAYKKIFSGLKPFLHSHSFALFEIGIFQDADMVRLVRESGLSLRGIYPDLAGIPRVAEITSGDK